jgi:DNA repair protein RAD57
VLTPIQDIAKRCRTSPAEIKRILDAVLNAIPLPDLPTLSTPGLAQDETFTTGDEILDDALNGGIRTGMVWEVVGERYVYQVASRRVHITLTTRCSSSAGKTQLALQLSLSVQLPRELGGLDGCVCFLTTSSKLPTNRLEQIAEAHERLSLEHCSLDNVHTIAIPTVDILQTIITSVFPAFIEQQASEPRPVKLLVIDALAELFHSANKTSTLTLVERSKNLVSLSSALHQLAHKHRIAVVVLNEVIERFSRPQYGSQSVNNDLLLYEEQSRWFNTAQYFGDGTKEAALGLVWANQVNTRIMLSRTLRRRYLQPDDFSKRQRLSASTSTVGLPDQTASAAQFEESQPTLIRRMCVLFSNICQPVALDYIVSEKGITILDSSEDASPRPPPRKHADDKPLDANMPGQSEPLGKAPLRPTADIEGDADDQLWDQLDPLDGLDWDKLEQTLSQAVSRWI